MSAFIDARINSNYRFGFTGGPEWKTFKRELQNGHVRKNKDWQYPLCRWTTDYALLNDQQREAMRSAFWVCGGGFSDFRFRDWDDFRAIRQVFHEGDGTSTPVQLKRNYSFGSVTFSRLITLPLNAVVRDEDDNVLAVAVDPLTGLVTPASPWPMGKDILWDGEFDVRACFASDYNPMTWEAGKVASCPVTIIESRG